MASLVLNSVSASSITWNVTGLSLHWNTTNYQTIVIATGTTSNGSLTAPSGIVDSVSPPSSGTSYDTQSSIWGGLSPNTSYTVNGYAKTLDNKWWSVGSLTTTTLSNPPPDVPGTVLILNITNTTADIIWAEVTNADSYNVNITGPGYNQTVNVGVSSYQASGLNPGTTYSVSVQSVNINGTSAYNSPTNFTTTNIVSPPSPWAWSSAFINQTTFNTVDNKAQVMDASEWNNFVAKIEEIGNYKSITVVMSNVSSGLAMKTYVEQAVTAIIALGGSITMNYTVTKAFFEDLKNALNNTINN